MLKFNLIAVYLKISFLCEAQLKLKDSAEIFFSLIEKGQLLDIMLWVDSFFLFYLLFLIGLTGILFNYKNYLVTMFCIELMYLGITICFIIVSIATADPKGQIYAIILLVFSRCRICNRLRYSYCFISIRIFYWFSRLSRTKRLIMKSLRKYLT